MKFITSEILEYFNDSILHEDLYVTPSASTPSEYIAIDGIGVRFSDHYSPKDTKGIQVIKPISTCIDDVWIVFYKDAAMPMLMSTHQMLDYIRVTVLNMRIMQAKTNGHNSVKQAFEQRIAESIYPDSWFESRWKDPIAHPTWAKLGCVLGTLSQYKELNKSDKDFIRRSFDCGKITVPMLRNCWKNSESSSEFIAAIRKIVENGAARNAHDFHNHETLEELSVI